MVGVQGACSVRRLGCAEMESSLGQHQWQEPRFLLEEEEAVEAAPTDKPGSGTSDEESASVEAAEPGGVGAEQLSHL